MKKYTLPFIVIAILIASFSLILPANAHFDRYPPTICPYTDAPNYNPNLAVTVKHEQLQLVEASSGKVLRVLEDQVLDFYHHGLYWGKNCRYFFANDIVQPFTPYPVRFTTIYDVSSGARIFRTRRDPFFTQVWSPSRQQFIIKSIDGTFFISESLSQPILLFKHNPAGVSMRRYQWDTNHNQLLVIFADNSGYLNIYDMNSGATLASISNPDGCAPPVDYTITGDQHTIIVFTGTGYPGKPACVTLYNRDNGAQQSINAGTFTATHPSQIALSPDGRFLAIGMLALRVWDLANLPANFGDRVPIHRYEGPTANIQSIHFVDALTIETTSAEGTQQWNVITGKLLSQ